MDKFTILVGLGSVYMLWKNGYLKMPDSQPAPIIVRKRSTMTELMINMIVLCLIAYFCLLIAENIIKSLTKILDHLKNSGFNVNCCMSANKSYCDNSSCSNTDYDSDLLDDKVFIENNLNECSPEKYSDKWKSETKDIKISSDSLGNNNVVVYKVITDQELDNDCLNLEDDPKIKINKLNKPLKNNNKKINKKHRNINKIIHNKNTDIEDNNPENTSDTGINNTEDKLDTDK